MTYLTWLCGKCSFAIGDHAGAVGVAHADITEYQAAERERDTSGSRSVADLAELINGPGPVKWLPYHYRCVSRDAYCIEVFQLRTLEGVMRWTADLMSKAWLDLTDWDYLLRQVAGEAPSKRVRRSEQ